MAISSKAIRLSIWVTLLAVGVSWPRSLARDFSQVEVKATKLADGVYMLRGEGGNLGLSVGHDGPFLIDDQFAPLTEKIQAAVAQVSEKPIRFVLNTHWHGDHTGGNENLGKAGSLIVAHDNVRRRMSVEHFNEVFDRKTPPSPAGALPVVTFTRAVTFHLNGDEIHAFHLPHAHTDGDAIIHFRKANVIHMGDIFWNGSYPFIDYTSGGSIDGVISAVNHVLEMTDSETKLIAGHGPLGGLEELKAYRDLLADVRERIVALMAEGKSMEAIIAAKPTARYDDEWGQGFLKPDQFVEIVYRGLEK